MKLRISVIALSAALGAACTTTEPSRPALDVRPTLSIRHSTETAAAYYQLGRYYHGQNRLALAEEAYRRATALDAGHIDALNALGSLYAERGELERATESFAQAVALAPEAAYLHNNLGYAYHLQGRIAGAYAALYQAVRRDPGFERAWLNLERLAEQRPDAPLSAAVATRQVDRLPATLSAMLPEAEPAKPATPPVNPAASAVAADAAGGEASGEPAAAPPAAATEAVPPPTEPEMTELASAATSAMDFSALRIEVSNGNGVRRFARNFGSQLRADGIPVSRITNLGSFRLRQTVVEFQPGHEHAARALNVRLGLAARIVPAIKPRSRSDIRIALGQDLARLTVAVPDFKRALASL